MNNEDIYLFVHEYDKEGEHIQKMRGIVDMYNCFERQ